MLDVLIIGAGLSGMYQLHLLRKQGLSVRVYEAGDDVGGTWYWNRYPGARFDSESYSYGYSFSEELLDEWQWSEHFAAQPENLRYCRFVADKFDLRRDITFGERVVAAHFDEQANSWDVRLSSGEVVRTWLLITAIGPLSVPVMPDIEGIDDFAGFRTHTANWPHEPVSFAGKRVGVIGTGATGVQLITEVAKTAGHLTVFQRTPNWCAPLGNAPITEAEQAQIRREYPSIFAACRESHGAFIHKSDPRNMLDVTEAERQAFFEQKYAEPGFGIWMGNFRDAMTDPEANAMLSAFVADKIRGRVVDPEVAERLIPKNHGFGTRRVPMESGYYEVYNQDNVQLVDVASTPIERITSSGLRTSDASFELDMLIFATGFDAVTGGFAQIDIRGEAGHTLSEHWENGPRTFLGLFASGFPNMMTLVGAHNAASFCNIPRCIEQNVDWVAELVAYLRAKGHTLVAAEPTAEAEWTAHVLESGERMLFTQVDSWFMGINRNIGKTERQFLVYAAGVPAYRERCDEVAQAGYAGLRFG